MDISELILNEKLTQEEIDHIKAGKTREERRDRERDARRAEMHDAGNVNRYIPNSKNEKRVNTLARKFINRMGTDKDRTNRNDNSSNNAKDELKRRDDKYKAKKIVNSRGWKESAIMDIEFK